MCTNREVILRKEYDSLIGEGVLFSLKEIQQMKIIRQDMAKKLIYKGEIEIVKIGSKIFISKSVLID